MKYSSIPSARNIVLSCKANGIKHIVISPGSRNAPLTLGFTNDSFFHCFSIVDERSAAFFAMGIAQQLGSPVAVVCTSGSALLNYHPAVAEAFYSDIPLVVISADRPPYKIDIGDGQTIRQDFVFERHIGYSANLKLDVSHAVAKIEAFDPFLLETTQEEVEHFNQEEVERALLIARTKKLPVHINIPFEEPLYGLVDSISQGNEVATTTVAPEKLATELLSEARTIWAKSKKKMVLVGVNPPNRVAQEYLEILAHDPSTLVFTETTSNLHHPNFFPSIDSIIFPIEKSEDSHSLFSSLQPDILLTIGGLVVSKKVKAFLRSYRPKQHWHVHEEKAYDTYLALSEHFKTNANDFLEALLANTIPLKSEYRTFWETRKKEYEQKRTIYLGKIPFSDFKAFDSILATIPAGYQLQLSNSSTVRYAQLFDMDKSIAVYCNRGTSGIDGSTSTAIGAAYLYKNPTVLITGDLSFFYDSNALWNNYIRNDFRIVLVNNSGGGIFRILPGFDSSERFSRFFETTHGLTAEHLCQQFGFQYISAENEKELKGALQDFYDPSDRPKVVEIFTPREVNNKILLDYFDFISSDY